jgi:hypothetical protein
MENSTMTNIANQIISPLITISGILIGVWQFNQGQKNLQEKELEQRRFELTKMQVGSEFEAIAKFKEIQSAKYREATEIISNIIYTENYQSPEFKKYLKRFWQLYWVELSAVEDENAESAMVSLGDYIKELQMKNFNPINSSEKAKLFNLGYNVAQAIKVSSKNWELPKGLQK